MGVQKVGDFSKDAITIRGGVPNGVRRRMTAVREGEFGGGASRGVFSFDAVFD
jgi:hypothetical protein